MLSSYNQSLALYNRCQEVVSKGGLDRFVRLSWSSITLIFNTLEANNKKQQLSRGSKPLNVRQYLTGKTLMKSQTSGQKESRTRFRPYIGMRSISVSRGLFGRPGRWASRCLSSRKKNTLNVLRITHFLGYKISSQ